MIRIFNQYISAKSIIHLLVESCIILLSLAGAAKLRFWNNPSELALYVTFPDFALQSAIVLIVCLICFYCNELYDLSANFGGLDRVLRIEQSLGVASLLLGI